MLVAWPRPKVDRRAPRPTLSRQAASPLRCRQDLGNERFGTGACRHALCREHGQGGFEDRRLDVPPREVQFVVFVQRIRQFCAYSHIARSASISLPYLPIRPGRSLRLLSCHRAVVYPAPPGLTVEYAATPEIPRRRAKRLISASAPTISAQTDCRLVPCLFPAPQLRDQASEVPLRVDGRSARRRMCHSASLTSSGTMHLTSRAHGRRVLTLAYLEQHVACVSVCRTRCHLRRNTRPSAGQSSARCAP